MGAKACEDRETFIIRILKKCINRPNVIIYCMYI